MERDNHHFPHHHRVKYEPHQHEHHHRQSHHHHHHNHPHHRDNDDDHHHPRQHHHHHHHHHHHRHHPTQSLAAQAEETARLRNLLHLQPFHHQVAGQSLVFCYDPYTICKSLIPRELQFYETLPDVLAPFVPRYKGIVDIPLKAPSRGENGQTEGEVGGEDGGANHPLATQRLLNKVARPRESHDNVYHFILLENIVAGMQRPCILDLKMGTRQHGDSAPPSKAQYQINKCRSTTSAMLGVRLCGMKVYQVTTDDYLQANKHEGRKMRKDDFRETMFQFLFNGRHFRRDLIGSLLLQLEKLKEAIAQLPTYRFYSSSLLIVYDGLERPCPCDTSPRLGIPSDQADLDRNGIHDSDPHVPSCNSPEPEPCCDVTSCDDFEAVPSCDVISCKRVEEVPSSDVTSCDDDFKGVPLCDVTSCNSVEAVSPCDITSCASVDTQLTCRERADSLAEPILAGESQNGVAVDNPGFRDAEDDVTNDVTNDLGATDELCRGREGPVREEQNAYVTDSAVEAPPSPTPRGQHECRCGLGRVVVRMVDFAHTTFQGYDGDSVVHHGTDHGYLLGLQSLVAIFSALYTSDR